MKNDETVTRDAILEVFSNYKGVLKVKYRTTNIVSTPMHSLTLQIINRETDCTSQRVSRVLNRDKAQIAKLIGELIGQGFVVGLVSPSDKRRRILSLTPEGKAALRALQRVEKTSIRQMTKGLSAEEVDQFVKTARKMVDNAKKIRQC